VKKNNKKFQVQEEEEEEEVKEGNSKHDQRAIAIADLFERKRQEYHEQGREEIKRHLAKSKKRLAKLEKLLKLSNRTKITGKKLELPSHLQSGASNNFKVDESLKSCWYDKVAEMYLMKRGNHRKEKVTVPVAKVIKPVHLKKVVKESGTAKKKVPINVVDAPEMASLSTKIQMDDEAIYYCSKYDQKFHSEREDGRIRYKKVMDQVARTKEVTLNGLVRNGISIVEQIDREVEEETVLINIMDDDEFAEDDKDKSSFQRKKSFFPRKSFTELLNSEKVITRRSFLLNRNNSRGNDSASPVGDVTSSVSEDEIVNIGLLNPSFNNRMNLNTSFRLMSIRNSQINEGAENSTSNLATTSLDNILPSDIIDSLHDAEVAQKTKTKKVIEPLTWDDMVEIEQPKVAVPEKVPLMKWQNPTFN
jgi:hypothetical protein